MRDHPWQHLSLEVENVGGRRLTSNLNRCVPISDVFIQGDRPNMAKAGLSALSFDSPFPLFRCFFSQAPMTHMQRTAQGDLQRKLV